MREEMDTFLERVRRGYTFLDFRRAGMRQMEYIRVRDEALKLGLIEWRNPRDHNKGVVIKEGKS